MINPDSGLKTRVNKFCKTGLFFAIGKVAPNVFASFIVSPLRARESDKYKKRNGGKKQINC